MKTGKALVWAQAKLTELAKKSTWDYSWEDCTKDLRSAFGDRDIKATAQSKIKKVKQGTSSVLTYIINFEEYEYDTGYNEEALVNLFVSGLAFHITWPIFSSQILSSNGNDMPQLWINSKPIKEKSTASHWAPSHRICRFPRQQIKEKTKAR